MNIYEKVNMVKAALYEKGIKKTGRNDFSKYDYFELADFLPEIVKQEAKLGINCTISFGTDLATLTIVNCEKPDERITVASPMSTASLKGMHEVQNLGAVQTYLRRYLYVAAFEIVEQDMVDGQKEHEQPKQTSAKHAPKGSDNLLTADQRNAIGALVKTDEDKANMKAVITKLGYDKLASVKQYDYERLLDHYNGIGLPFELTEDN